MIGMPVIPHVFHMNCCNCGRVELPRQAQASGLNRKVNGRWPSFSYAQTGLKAAQKKATARDLWLKQEVPGGPQAGFVVGEVQPHAVWALRFVPSKADDNTAPGTH
jgi:hypothetical protein